MRRAPWPITESDLLLGTLRCGSVAERCAWLPRVTVRMASAQIIQFGREAPHSRWRSRRPPGYGHGPVPGISRPCLGASYEGHELGRGGLCLGGHHGVDVGAAVAAVLGAVGGVDLVVEVVVGVGERDVLVHPAGLDAAVAAFPGAAEPGASGPPVGADVQVVAVADHPGGYR